MRPRPARFLLAACLALPLATPAPAGEVTFPQLADAVPGAGGATYLELARHVLPDLALEGETYEGRAVIDLRHLGGADMAGPPPEGFSVFDVPVTPVRAGGRDRLLMLLDLGQAGDLPEGFAALALLDPAGKPQLLDAAQVAFDRSTYFRDPAAVPLGPDDDLLLTMSTHFNSQQGYVTTAMTLVRDGRLQLVDTVFTFDERVCGFERIQLPAFRAGERGDRPYADIVVTVTEETKRTEEDCGAAELPDAGVRAVEVTYRWDAAQMRFLPDSDALEVLARETEDRF